MKTTHFLLKSFLGALALALPAHTALAASLTAEAAQARQASATPIASEWKQLFNGKDLNGWIVRGSDKPIFSVVDGEIVGTIVPGTPNTFLCTEKIYGDFVLELEYNCHPDVNSGIQIRSDDSPAARIIEDYPQLPGKTGTKKIRIQGNHVSGYQVEIEPRFGRTGGIYDENRRNGWAYPIKDSEEDKAFIKKAREIEKPGTWQRLRVEASGDTIRTYLDGVPRANLTEKLPTKSGFIALQVHSASKRDAGKQIRFRNITIREVNVDAPTAVPSR